MDKDNLKKGYTMNLNIKNRLILVSQFLPKEGNLLTMTVVKDIKDKVELSQAEMAEYGLKIVKDGGLSWNEKGNSSSKEIIFTTAELSILKEKVDELDKNAKLTLDVLPLCDLIKENERKQNG